MEQPEAGGDGDGEAQSGAEAPGAEAQVAVAGPDSADDRPAGGALPRRHGQESRPRGRLARRASAVAASVG